MDEITDVSKPCSVDNQRERSFEMHNAVWVELPRPRPRLCLLAD